MSYVALAKEEARKAKGEAERGRERPGSLHFRSGMRAHTHQKLRMRSLRLLENLQLRPALRKLSTVGKPALELYPSGSAPACPLLITLALWQKRKDT